jgi:hypothetical protein
VQVRANPGPNPDPNPNPNLNHITHPNTNPNSNINPISPILTLYLNLTLILTLADRRLQSSGKIKARKSKKVKKKSLPSEGRTYSTQNFNVCDGSDIKEVAQDGVKVDMPSCVDLLIEIKTQGKNHWVRVRVWFRVRISKVTV